MLALLALVHGAWSHAAARDQAPTPLEGTWIGVKSEAEATSREFQPGEMQLVFKGDKLLATGLVSHSEKAVAFSINPSTTPKQLDYWPSENEQMPRIYEVSGDTLRIAVPRGGSVRPSRISADKGSGSVVITLKRQSAPERE